MNNDRKVSLILSVVPLQDETPDPLLLPKTMRSSVLSVIDRVTLILKIGVKASNLLSGQSHLERRIPMHLKLTS